MSGMQGPLIAILMLSALLQVPALDVGANLAQSASSLPTSDQNAPPVIDIALRMVRVAAGGSSIARSAARADGNTFLYARLGSCVMSASEEDPFHEDSVVWRASGRVRSIERGIAVADVEWQRLEHRPTGVVAGHRVRTTLTLPLGERVAADFVEVSKSVCGMAALIFEIGVAPDHGRRLAMSSEGRSGGGSSGVGGGGIGRRLTPAEVQAQAERRRQGDEAARAASVVHWPMPPREYNVDVWLVPAAPVPSSPPTLAQRLTQVLGGTGGRFAFPPIPLEAGNNRAVVVEVTALVIPVRGERLIVAITRHVTPSEGAVPISAGWLRVVAMPKAADVLSFEIPLPEASEQAIVPRQGFGLRVRVAHR